MTEQAGTVNDVDTEVVDDDSSDGSFSCPVVYPKASGFGYDRPSMGSRMVNHRPVRHLFQDCFDFARGCGPEVGAILLDPNDPDQEN